MRPLTALLLVTIATAACASPERPPADTVVALVPMPPESATATPSTATPLPAPIDSPRRAATTATATAKATPRRTSSDTARSRPTPPKKAPGGFIMVPPRTFDSLRMAPPATSTRP